MADIGEIQFLQQQKLARISSQQRLRRAQLAEEQRQFDIKQANRNQILAMFEPLIKPGGSNLFSGIPELRRNIELFERGGQFGAGGKAEVERGGQQAIAAGQIGLAQTGVSSGTNVAGLRARVLADTALARKKIEDERIAQLGGALSQAGQARLTQQQLASREREAALRTLGSFR